MILRILISRNYYITSKASCKAETGFFQKNSACGRTGAVLDTPIRKYNIYAIEF